jgi:hypothetical protein
MDNSTASKLGFRRLIITLLVALAVVWIGSEVAFYFMKESTDRAPVHIELVIPAGTADKIAAGEAVPSIPDEMVFVLGDTLVVRNEDSVDHELGPLWIPPHSNASLLLDTADRYAYSCSFQPSQYLGLNVKLPTTWETRLTALAYSVPATTVFFFIYSLVLWPIKPKLDETKPAELHTNGKPSTS